MAEDKPMEEKSEAPTTIKLGDKEYSQDELSQLVGLGETAREFETKWNRPISQFYPDYTQKSQKLAEFERQEQERQKAELEKKAQEGNLSPEEARRVALEQAKELGIVTRDEFDNAVKKTVAEVLAGKQLLEDVNAVISEQAEKGLPKASVQDLLDFMDENGIRNPEKAYKLKFEADIDKWKEDQIRKIKPDVVTTQDVSTAGAKVPPPTHPPTADNLAQRIRETLTRRSGV